MNETYRIGQLPITPRGEKRRPFHRGYHPEKAVPHRRCPCGFRIRSERHNDGGHHKGQKFGN